MRLEPVRRIGLTMREVIDPATGEARDALAKDWAAFLQAAVPEIAWCPIPNVGDRVARYVDDWQLEGVCLTGGDDIGRDSLRDRTELALLDHCFTAQLPVLGVCRGMQRIWTTLGGRLRKVVGHAGTTHSISLTTGAIAADGPLSVNSFHHMGLDVTSTPPSVTCIAHAEDGCIEAIMSEQPRILGLMWHPERAHAATDTDRRLLRWLLRHD